MRGSRLAISKPNHKSHISKAAKVVTIAMKIYKNEKLGFSLEIPEELYERGLKIDESYFGNRGSLISFSIGENLVLDAFWQIYATPTKSLRPKELQQKWPRNNRFIFNFLDIVDNPWVSKEIKQLAEIYGPQFEASFKTFDIAGKQLPGQENMD
jgi:hypothetical protein